MPAVTTVTREATWTLSRQALSKRLHDRDDGSRPGETSAYVIIVVPVVLGLALIIGSVIACVCYRRKRRRQKLREEQARAHKEAMQLRQRVYI